MGKDVDLTPLTQSLNKSLKVFFQTGGGKRPLKSDL